MTGLKLTEWLLVSDQVVIFVKKQILLVDDNPDWREILSFVLIGEGFSVLTARDGSEALEILKAAKPDLIITDISMPNIDGIELIKLLREQAPTTSLPIVVVSAYAGQLTLDPIKAGASEVMQKPIEIYTLLRLIKQILS